MDYKEMLEVVKKQNPDVPFKQQQKMASEMHKRFKAAAETYSGGGEPPEAEASNEYKASQGIAISSPAKPKVLPMAQLAAAEKRLRADVIDINSLRTVGLEVIPHGEVKKHGKDGVNTMVSFEDAAGNRLPLVGYFRIFI